MASKNFNVNLKTVGGVIATIMGFFTLFETGALNPFNEIIIYEYTLNQLIFLTLVDLAFAIIIYETLSGTRKPEDFVKDTTQMLQDIGDMSDVQAERFMDDITHRKEIEQQISTKIDQGKQSILSKISGLFGRKRSPDSELIQYSEDEEEELEEAVVNVSFVKKIRFALSKKNRELKEDLQTYDVMKPSELLEQLRSKYNALSPSKAYAIMAIGDANEEFTEKDRIEVIESIMDNGKIAEEINDYMKRSNRKTIIVIAVSVLAYLIVYFLKAYGIF